MSFRHLVKYATTLSLRAAVRKATKFGAESLVGHIRNALERNRQTIPPPASAHAGAPLLAAFDVSSLTAISETIERVCKRYIEHRFDLLGSGWLEVAYGLDRDSLTNPHHTPHWPDESVSTLSTKVSPGNRQRAREIRNRIAIGYRPVDWQLDFKSGYRWREDRRSETVNWGHEPGVDIKVPWELARMHHLVQIAIAGCDVTDQNNEKRVAYAEEFRNQVLDFAAANPPGYGVNWSCTMDVAIRAANLVLAFDLFRHTRYRFDDGFLSEFHALIKVHCEHIAANLEWQEEQRANHFFADLTGLLFAAAWLPSSPKSNLWLAFAASTFIKEFDRQFAPDGTNFEASTNYHRLSAEMAIYGTALILGLPKGRRQALSSVAPDDWNQTPRIDGSVLKRLADEAFLGDVIARKLLAAAEFTMHVTKPNGSVVQIGDTDNGRLFKLSPGNHGPDLSEDPLDHRACVGAAAGLFERLDFQEFAGPSYGFETAVVAALARGKKLPNEETNQSAETRRITAALEAQPASRTQRTLLVLPEASMTDGLTAAAYPDFGLYLWRGPRLFVSIRCGPIGPTGPGAHAHNDQLAMEIQIDGVDWARDPGSYLYSADAVARDRYRSHLAHAVPRFENREPSRLDFGMFALEDNAKARCIRFDETGFHGFHEAYGTPLFREIVIEPGRIVVTDGIGGTVPPPDTVIDETVVRSATEIREPWGLKTPFSPGYGKIE